MVKSLISVVSASRVVASGWDGGKCGSQCSLGHIHSVTEEILIGEHSNEQSGRKERKYFINKRILFHGKHTICRARMYQDQIVE